MSIVVEFGSKARGDDDSISDLDILIVTNGETIKYESSNFVKYTKNRLKSMKKAESLFLVHLRNEGNIKKDEEHWMENFLANIPDFQASEEDIYKSKRNLETILSIQPKLNSRLWWFDCVYVFLRDYIIKINSISKIYTFSVYDLGKFVDPDDKFGLTKLITDLRFCKVSYRSGLEINIALDANYVRDVISNVFGLKFKSIAFADIIANKSFESYFKLRTIEGAILENKIIINNSKIRKYILNPHRYTWELKNINLNKYIKWS